MNLKRYDKILYLVIALSLMAVLPGSATAIADDVSISGAFLGIAGGMEQDNEISSDPRRRGFDFAANVDFGLQIADGITGLVQLQLAPGGGKFGFVNGVEVADLNLELEISETVILTAGSFDFPFGEQATRLTNNGDASGSPFVINTLFYSALAGTPVGTLNTLGGMLSYSTETITLDGALTNGTDETADNPDGNVGGALRIGVSPARESGLRFGGSIAYSDDTEESGSSGTRSQFMAFIGEAGFESDRGISIHTYVGQADYDDNMDDTKDMVLFWMAEGAFTYRSFEFAGRVSDWIPEDDDGSRNGISRFIPNPGYAIIADDTAPVRDQKVTRLQGAVRLTLRDNVRVSAEAFFDSYSRFSDRKYTDVAGGMLVLSGSF